MFTRYFMLAKLHNWYDTQIDPNELRRRALAGNITRRRHIDVRQLRRHIGPGETALLNTYVNENLEL